MDNKTEVNIFTRSDSSNVHLTYQGKGQAAEYEDTIPVTIYWKFGMRNEEDYTNEELAASVRYPEGAIKSVLVNDYERNRQARKKCLEYYGCKCSVCGIEFNNVYGDIGNEFMHVHHLKMIHEIGQEYEVDPIKDLRPVCPNCHSMIHKKIPPFTIEEMRKFIKKNNIK
ncbi:HNH endonuclease family protein [Clostridium botulinum]|uniref:HNH endonuclease n=1 Tax=Clostridium botulinum TaxID=1491 RepID=UPI001000F756|nr:HNH endonuclease [Clostridium botulinum]RUT53111.1 HNH endonuclease family protein [Clostridium botulinum]